MRIRFNAWDKFENKMILWEDMIKDAESEHLIAEVLLNSVRYVPLLFTGTCDNSAEDLYVGDVYMYKQGKCFNTSVIGSTHTSIRQVYCLSSSMNIRKIGNRYENPELLADANKKEKKL
jgi:hypothetical protein